jgi:hypothetical protein
VLTLLPHQVLQAVTGTLFFAGAALLFKKKDEEGEDSDEQDDEEDSNSSTGQSFWKPRRPHPDKARPAAPARQDRRGGDARSVRHQLV